MHDFLSLRAVDLSRLAITIQTNLDSAAGLIGPSRHATGVGTSVDSKKPRQPTRTGRLSKGNSSGPLLPMDNRGPFDIATLAIFPEYVVFDARDVLRFVVAGAAGRTIK